MNGWVFPAEAASGLSGFANVSEQNGISISITGMVIVFLVLALISLLLVVLPTVVSKLDEIIPPSSHGHQRVATAKSSTAAQASDDEVLAAVGFVMHTRLTQKSN